MLPLLNTVLNCTFQTYILTPLCLDLSPYFVDFRMRPIYTAADAVITQTNRTRYTPGINYFDCLHMRRPLKTLWVCSFPFPPFPLFPSSYFPLLPLSPPPLFPPLPCHGLGPGGALKLFQWVRVEPGRQTIFGKFGAKIGFDDTDFSSVCSRNNYYK